MFRIPPDSPGIIQLVDGQTAPSQAFWTVELNGARPSGVHAFRSRRERDGGPRGARRAAARSASSPRAEWSAERVARSPEIPRLLEELGQDADVVILDTPPALATVEMAELSGLVDGVLVVVRHGRVTRRSLVSLSRQAEGWRSDIIGAVLTDSPSEEDEYYYYKN